MKKFLSLMLAGVACLGLVACSSNEAPETEQPETEQPETEQPEAGGEKVLYSNGGPQEFFETPWLNPGSFTYNKTIYDQLLEADENLNPIGGELASEYNLSEDGTTLTFTLKDGITWHDGEAITTDDVKWSIEYSMKTPVLNAVFNSTFNAIKGAEAYVAGDADTLEGIVAEGNTLTITFDKPAPDALLTFTQFSPLPQKYFDGVDPLQIQQAEFFQNPVGSGPFKVDEVKMNDYTVLVPFEQYHNGVADYKIQLTPSPGDSDANFVNNARSGLLDYGYTKNVADIQALEGVDGLTITPVNVRYTRLFYANQFPDADGNPSPLADARVRQAIRYAIDMETIGQNLFAGTIVAANNLTPDGGSKVDGLENYDFNPEKAKELLAEANWDENTELDVVYYYTDQLTVDFMTAIQAYLAEVGIKMNFRLVEGDLATLLWSAPEDAVNGPAAVDWDLCYGAVSALSLHEYYDRFLGGYASNSHTPQNDELDSLINATNVMDPTAQQEAFFNLQKFENENMFAIPLYYQPVFVVTSDKVVNGMDAFGNPQFHYNWDVQNWEITAQ